MIQLFRFEFGKLFHKKILLAALGAYVAVMAILLVNQSVAGLVVKTADGQTYHGREAVAYDKAVTDRYSGTLDADKVNDILQSAIGSGNPEALSYEGDWMTKSIAAMFVLDSWDEAEPVSGDDIEEFYPQTKEKPFKIGYTRGWETAMVCIESMLLIAGFLIVITVAPVFSEEYATGMDALILTGKKGKSTCIYAKILASVSFSFLLGLFTIGVPAATMLIQYGTTGWDASVQVAVHGLFWSVPYTVSCLSALVLVAVFALVGCILLTCMTLLLSALCRNSFTAVLSALFLYVLPIVLIGKLDILLLNQLLSIMPSGDFNIALVLGMKDMSIGTLDIPMSWLNVILTALMGIGAWAGSRRIFGGHQVT
ncbi:hypothetical protein [Extibacter muris]|uniref:hypothetical protein n=1 Tax=Extibacter muris TaxID=1796622 RepID=UPI001D0652C0|nr:hypothetical protein [Extibacter muris]MCB6202841.1 hypothetical protein [Extibacter muris]MCQ4664149.1 hypothetical protein [Extibacter muris]MCQ4692927.1 hypothetical protein [Extibacter muris]